MGKRQKIDKKSYKLIQNYPCIACGHIAPSEVDHILTRGSRPDLINNPLNWWPLCNKCHREKGLSLKKFVEKYDLSNFLMNRGFFQCDMTGKWFYLGG